MTDNPSPVPTPGQRLIVAGMRVFFKLLYHQIAWTYDWVAATVSVGMWQTWIASVLPYLAGPRILELGHGPGHLQVELIKRGRSVYGLDESWQMSRQALSRLRRIKKNPGLVNGYAQFLPFPGAAFNQVVATFPTDYITDSRTLAEIWRVLAPQGELIVLPYAWITGRRPIHRLAARLFDVTGESPKLRQSLIQDHFVQPLQRAGFQPVIELLELPDSQLLLLRGRKVGPGAEV